MAAEPAAILIVDDEILNRDLLEQELQAAGYRTLSAASGGQAIDIAARSQPALIQLDAVMAGRDGFAACERLKGGEATRRIPVIFLTALTDTEVKLRAFKAGAVDYITKPVRPQQLELAVEQALELVRLRRENETLRREVMELRNERQILGDSPVMRRLMQTVSTAAPTRATVLLQGESGTGKELFARSLHALSARAEAPFVAINCAAIPETLLESEIFGHEKGSFTGASELKWMVSSGSSKSIVIWR